MSDHSSEIALLTEEYCNRVIYQDLEKDLSQKANAIAIKLIESTGKFGNVVIDDILRATVAVTLIDAGLLTEAKQLISKIAHFESRKWVSPILADSQIELGLFDDAIETAEEIRKSDSRGCAEVYQKLANAQAANGLFDEAAISVNELTLYFIRSMPLQTSLRFWRGQADSKRR